MEFKQSSFCFGHGVGAHVCGIAGLSFERLNHMNSDKYQSVIFIKMQNNTYGTLIDYFFTYVTKCNSIYIILGI